MYHVNRHIPCVVSDRGLSCAALALLLPAAFTVHYLLSFVTAEIYDTMQLFCKTRRQNTRSFLCFGSSPPILQECAFGCVQETIMYCTFLQQSGASKQGAFFVLLLNVWSGGGVGRILMLVYLVARTLDVFHILRTHIHTAYIYTYI